MARNETFGIAAFGAATALALGLAAAGCGNERVSDATISESVSKRLDADPNLAASDIRVETENGMVTIDGRVSGQQQRDEAERIARSTAGVKSVANMIEVSGSASPPAGGTMAPPPVASPPAGTPSPRADETP